MNEWEKEDRKMQEMEDFADKFFDDWRKDKAMMMNNDLRKPARLYIKLKQLETNRPDNHADRWKNNSGAADMYMQLCEFAANMDISLSKLFYRLHNEGWV